MQHYNAFISYKHAPLDNKIAASIVKDLEHYHIPKKIQKETGMKRIERIFRDKDELPITSDLNDNISEALRDADYLIVICSTNTKKSTWVEKEIEFFLQNHELNHVLTVLADGEPGDVIPKCLLTGKREVVDENGEKHMVDMPYEPLSCDYRLPVRKAKAEELPRLVAAIVGCSYDSLINRQRQYKMRRMSAIFAGATALSIGFAGYMLYSNTLIQKNYIESLRNQSKYLANESSKQLDDNNRIVAMQLALEALPADENDQRPITPEAVKSLSKASLAYVSPQASNVSAIWNYEMPNDIEGFRVNEDGTILAAVDYEGVLAVWDTETHKQIIFVNNPEDRVEDTLFFDADTLVVRRRDTVGAYNLKTGEALWTNENHSSMIMCDYVFKYTDNSVLAVCNDGHLVELSVKDGSIVKDTEMFDSEDEIYTSIRRCAMSEDRTRIAFDEANREDYNNIIYSLNEYNLVTGERNKVPTGEECTIDLAFFGDNIYVAAQKLDQDGSTGMYDYSFVTEDKTSIHCLASGDLSEKWSYDFTSSDMVVNRDFVSLTDSAVAYYSGNTSRIWDKESGELLKTHSLNDSIVDLSDFDQDGDPLYITRGGATATEGTVGNAEGMQLVDRFTDHLNQAYVYNGVYTLGYQSEMVIFYGARVYDEDWTAIEDMKPFSLAYNKYFLCEDVLCIMSPEGDGTKVILVDPEKKSYLGEVVVSDSIAPYAFQSLGAYDNKLYLTINDAYDLKLASVDLSSLEVSVEPINDEYKYFTPLMVIDGGKLAYCDNEGYEKNLVIVRDLSTGDEKKIELPYQYLAGMRYNAKSGLVYLMSEHGDTIVDTASGEAIEVEMPENWGTSEEVVFDKNGTTIATTDKNELIVIDSTGKTRLSISCQNFEPLGLSFFEPDGADQLVLVPCDNGTLLRYRADNGQFVGMSDITVYSNLLGGVEIDNYYDDHILHVRMGQAMDVVETDSWIETNFIESCYGYNKKTDTFLSYGYKNDRTESQVGYFKHYTPNDLILKARGMLNGTEMSQEQKSLYGIG